MSSKQNSRHLYLLRHAKSAWPEGIDDHDRPLAERGRKAVPLIAAFMADHKIRPDLALVSTARRTQETWDLLAANLAKAPTKRDAADLYEADASAIATLLRSIDPSVESLLVIGHNPGLQDFALDLVGGGELGARTRMAEKFPTAGLAVIRIGAWQSLSPASGHLEAFVTPRMLG